MLVKTVAFFCILVLFVTCEKAENNPNAECLLTKISLSDNAVVITIEYDANNNPSAVRTCYSQSGSGCFCSYPKYKNNKPYQTQIEPSCGKPEYNWIRDYTLNDKGQVIAQALNNSSNSDSACFLIREYNDQGRITKYYGSCDGPDSGKKLYFTYLSNGNIKEIIQNNWSAFDFQVYDDKKSILNDNPVWMLVTFESQFYRFLRHLGLGDSYAYSPNNPTKYRFYDERGYVTADLKYEYNVQGYPTKCEVSELIEDTNFTRKRTVFFEYKLK